MFDVDRKSKARISLHDRHMTLDMYSSGVFVHVRRRKGEGGFFWFFLDWRTMIRFLQKKVGFCFASDRPDPRRVLRASTPY